MPEERHAAPAASYRRMQRTIAPHAPIVATRALADALIPLSAPPGKAVRMPSLRVRIPIVPV
ncbi:hypothetical protein WJH60_26020 [Burkholderia orbicola]|uniref:hypothetical protein n=1 Tax=Burkholderia orbicola TaxID=2978683 RepID=UPI0035C6FDEE